MVLKEKNGQPRALYPAKVSFRRERKIRTFSDEGKLTEFVTNRPIVKKKRLNEILETKGNDKKRWDIRKREKAIKRKI